MALIAFALHYLKVATLSVLVGLPISGMLYQHLATKIDQRRYPPPGKLIDVGGHSLHINCTGQGDGPTVILEAGGSCSSLEWSLVQPEVATFAPVCSYDRAGLGWSQEGPQPRSGKRIVNELHTLLHKAQIPGPYIFVGHSIGGLFARLYASRWPDEVAGIVLVDSSYEYQEDKYPPMGQSRLEKIVSPGSILTTLARFGIIRLLSKLPSVRETVIILPAHARAPFLAHTSKTSHYKTTFLEIANERERETSAALEKAGDLGNMPLIVIKHGKQIDPKLIGENEEWTEKFYKIHANLQEQLAAKSANSKLIVAEQSGHMIPYQQPEIIIEAIREVIQICRENKERP